MRSDSGERSLLRTALHALSERLDKKLYRGILKLRPLLGQGNVSISFGINSFGLHILSLKVTEVTHLEF